MVSKASQFAGRIPLVQGFRLFLLLDLFDYEHEHELEQELSERCSFQSLRYFLGVGAAVKRRDPKITFAFRAETAPRRDKVQLPQHPEIGRDLYFGLIAGWRIRIRERKYRSHRFTSAILFPYCRNVTFALLEQVEVPASHTSYV